MYLMPEAKRVEVIRGIPSLKHVRIWWDFTLSYWLDVLRMASACAQKAFKLCFHKRSFFRRGQLILNGCHSTKIKWWNSPLHNYIVLYILVSRRSLSLRGTEKVFQWACGLLLWLLDGTSWMASKGGKERDLECILYVFCCDWATR